MRTCLMWYGTPFLPSLLQLASRPIKETFGIILAIFTNVILC